MPSPSPALGPRCSFCRRRVWLPRSQPARPGRLGSATKSVRSAAWTGAEEEFPAIFGNTQADTERGCGVTGPGEGL